MIEARNLDVAYGARRVLSQVDLTVSRGEFVCVVGRNGSGKSTLLRTLAGERAPQAGAVRIDGEDLRGLGPEAVAQKRAVLPQESALAFGFRVHEVVQMGRAAHRRHSSAAEDRRVIAECLAAVGLAEFWDRTYTRLSGGERQRVHLARVLAQVWPTADRPGGFALLDEPTSALDLAHVYGVLARVRALCAGGLGAVAVLHDLNAAARFADRVVVLSDGRVVADGPPAAAITPSLLEVHFGLVAAVSEDRDGRPLVTPLHPSTSHNPLEAA